MNHFASPCILNLKYFMRINWNIHNDAPFVTRVYSFFVSISLPYSLSSLNFVLFILDHTVPFQWLSMLLLGMEFVWHLFLWVMVIKICFCNLDAIGKHQQMIWNDCSFYCRRCCCLLLAVNRVKASCHPSFVGELNQYLYIPHDCHRHLLFVCQELTLYRCYLLHFPRY